MYQGHPCLLFVGRLSASSWLRRMPDGNRRWNSGVADLFVLLFIYEVFVLRKPAAVSITTWQDKAIKTKVLKSENVSNAG